MYVRTLGSIKVATMLNRMHTHISTRAHVCNGMDNSDIWDKYHECCIENRTNFTRPISNKMRVHRIYLKFSLLYVLADFCWCFHASTLWLCANLANKT